MRVIERGNGEPEYAVIGSIHGDEPCGKKAIERILDSDYDFKKPVKFVIANEKALERNVRFLDVDLNRNFPGHPESENYEERLAAKITKEVEELKVIDLHSTRSQPVPFMTIGSIDDEIMDRMCSSGVDKACYFEEGNSSTGGFFQCFIVEVGRQGTEEAAEMAYNILVNYLAAEGIIEEDFERSNPEIFKYYETVEGGNWEFLKTNFEKVETGEVFGKHGTTELVSTEDFYPVLMSTDGYEDILGQKARKMGRVSELRD